MGDYMKEASFSLAEAKFAMGDFNHLVLQNVSKAQLKVKLKKDNVAGLYAIFISHVYRSVINSVCCAKPFTFKLTASTLY